MARMVTGASLAKAVREGTFIRDGDPSCAEGIKYDFRLSARVLKASFGIPVDLSNLSVAERTAQFVEPGEMVFILSEEKLKLPLTMFAELSPKRKLSHRGVIVMGGFCIDPGYEGRLLIGLYNFSSSRFPLQPGKKVIAATFYELEGDENGKFQKPEASVLDFPDELVTVMQSYKPLAVQSIADGVSKLQNELDLLRKEIRSQDEWYRRFQSSLEGHDRQIASLLSGLEAEKNQRAAGHSDLSQAVTKISSTLTWLKGAAALAVALIGLVVVPLIIEWIKKNLGW